MGCRRMECAIVIGIESSQEALLTLVCQDTAGSVSVFLFPANGEAINRKFSFAIGWVEDILVLTGRN